MNFQLKVIHQQSISSLEREVNSFLKEGHEIISIQYKVNTKFDIYKKCEMLQYFAFIHYKEEK